MRTIINKPADKHSQFVVNKTKLLETRQPKGHNKFQLTIMVLALINPNFMLHSGVVFYTTSPHDPLYFRTIGPLECLVEE